jgi:hypothetical protein
MAMRRSYAGLLGRFLSRQRALPWPSFGYSLPARLPESTGTSYYVATNGNDSTGNGSIGSPWLTIQKALDTVPLTGSIVNVRAGTYVASGNQTIYSRAGNPSNPVTVQAYPGEKAIIDQSRFIVLNGGGIRLRNFEIRNAPASVANGVKIEGASCDIEVVGCIIHGASKTGLLIYGTAGASNSCARIQVWNCVIYSNGSFSSGMDDHGIYWGTANGTGNVMANCLLYNNCTFNVQIYPAAPGVIMTCNTVDGGQVHTIPTDTRGGVILGSEDSASTHDTITVGTITTNAPNHYGIGRYLCGPNNNAYDCVGYGNYSGDWNTGTPITFTNCVHADPLYVSRGAADYRLSAGSPARGFIPPARYGYVPAFDLNGDRRAAADAGCYRYG